MPLRCLHRRLRPAALLVAGLVAAVLCERHELWGGCFSLARQATAVGRGLRTPCRAAATDAAKEEETWREAYELELERNELLRDQLQSLGVKSLLLQEQPSALAVPEECAIDWADSYGRLAECNRALEAELRGGAGQQAKGAGLQGGQGAEATALPAVFQVRLPEAGTQEELELSPFFGRGSAFYSVEARLPLGLSLTKQGSGQLCGAFLVDDVLEGGSAKASGKILAGDILQALTVVMDGSDLGMKVEDFVSTVVGGLGRWRQTLTDASFIDSADDLVEAIQTNTVFGSDVKLVLIFERDTAALPGGGPEGQGL